MKNFFRELFAYNHYQNQQLAERFAARPDDITEKTIKLYSHVLDAHHIWIARIAAAKISYGPWDLHSPGACSQLDTLNYQQTLAVIDSYELTTIIHYANLKQQQFSKTVRDMLFHVINHSTYHRGQIAMEMRLNGQEPLITDYIFYKQ